MPASNTKASSRERLQTANPSASQSISNTKRGSMTDIKMQDRISSKSNENRSAQSQKNLISLKSKVNKNNELVTVAEESPDKDPNFEFVKKFDSRGRFDV